MIVIEKIRKIWLDANTLSDRLSIQNEVDGPQVTRGVGSTERIKALSRSIIEGNRASDGISDQAGV